MTQRRYKHFPVKGGEDLITPPIDISPSSIIHDENYECDRDGRARRVDGFEAFDGQPAPSEQSYWILDFDAGTDEIAAEDLVTGASSSDTGIAVIAGVVESGSYGSNDAAGYLVLTQVSGTFTNDENLQVSAVTKSVADGVVALRGADTSTLDDTYLQAAIEYARDQIADVPGEGDILGVSIYKENVYCWRFNVGSSQINMWKSSTSGWTQVPLGETFRFDQGGAVEPALGATITGAVSGETAIIERIVLQNTGVWSGSSAEGWFVISARSGTFTPGETLNIGGTTARLLGNISLSITATDTPVRFETVNHNFSGAADGLRMYGTGHNASATPVGGSHAGAPFEFDGTIFCPLRILGGPSNNPTHVEVFREHLFYGFSEGFFVHSSTGKPLEWTALGGASDFSLPAANTGLRPLLEGILAIFCKERIFFLSGDNSSDWVLTTYSHTSGGHEWSIQQPLGTIFLNDSGITTLRTVQEFGDFGSDVISKKIKPLIESKKALLISSMNVECKEQYRLFFSDNTGIIVTFNSGRLVGATRVDYGLPVLVTAVDEIADEEYLIFGSDDGYVYRMDKGNSFNGEALASSVTLAYNHLGSPENIKKFFKAVFEIAATAGTSFTLSVQYDRGYGIASDSQAASLDSGSGVWDGSTAPATLTSGEDFYLGQTGKSISFTLTSTGTYDDPHTLQGYTIHFATRGIDR